MLVLARQPGASTMGTGCYEPAYVLELPAPLAVLLSAPTYLGHSCCLVMTSDLHGVHTGLLCTDLSDACMCPAGIPSKADARILQTVHMGMRHTFSYSKSACWDSHCGTMLADGTYHPSISA
jgi:hypothetical protein